MEVPANIVNARIGSEWRAGVGADAVTVVLDPAVGGESKALYVFAHGAAGRMDDRGMLAVAAKLREHALDVVRFNFPYSEKRSRRPDPMPRLIDCIASVASLVRSEIGPQRLLIGGRSMGGRAASMLAANGFRCDGLLLLAYPLHPAGEPQKLRDAHLSKITVPVLCMNGTRDALCRRDLMDAVVSRLGANWQMHWLDGADHSFHVTKATARSNADVLDEIAAAVERWRSGLR